MRGEQVAACFTIDKMTNEKRSENESSAVVRVCTWEKS